MSGLYLCTHCSKLLDYRYTKRFAKRYDVKVGHDLCMLQVPVPRRYGKWVGGLNWRQPSISASQNYSHIWILSTSGFTILELLNHVFHAFLIHRLPRMEPQGFHASTKRKTVPKPTTLVCRQWQGQLASCHNLLLMPVRYYVKADLANLGMICTTRESRSWSHSLGNLSDRLIDVSRIFSS